MLRTKVVQKIKTHIICSIIFPPYSTPVVAIMWQTKECSVVFHCNHGYADAPYCYVIRTVGLEEDGKNQLD